MTQFQEKALLVLYLARKRMQKKKKAQKRKQLACNMGGWLKSKGNAALLAAVKKGQKDVVKLLLKKGANVDAKDM